MEIYYSFEFYVITDKLFKNRYWLDFNEHHPLMMLSFLQQQVIHFEYHLLDIFNCA